MFVTAEKERERVFFPFSCYPRGIKLRQAEHVKTMKTQTNHHRSQLSLM